VLCPRTVKGLRGPSPASPRRSRVRMELQYNRPTSFHALRTAKLVLHECGKQPRQRIHQPRGAYDTTVRTACSWSIARAAAMSSANVLAVVR
jgi:hypothetical protein